MDLGHTLDLLKIESKVLIHQLKWLPKTKQEGRRNLNLEHWLAVTSLLAYFALKLVYLKSKFHEYYLLFHLRELAIVYTTAC